MNSLKENDKVNFGQQAGMRFASLTQMPQSNLYFAEILPNDDEQRRLRIPAKRYTQSPQ